MTAPHQQDVGHDGPVHGQEGLPEEDEGLKTGGSEVSVLWNLNRTPLM